MVFTEPTCLTVGRDKGSEILSVAAFEDELRNWTFENSAVDMPVYSIKIMPAKFLRYCFRDYPAIARLDAEIRTLLCFLHSAAFTWSWSSLSVCFTNKKGSNRYGMLWCGKWEFVPPTIRHWTIWLLGAFPLWASFSDNYIHLSGCMGYLKEY